MEEGPEGLQFQCMHGIAFSKRPKQVLSIIAHSILGD